MQLSQVLVLWTAHQQPNPLHEETGQFRAASSSCRLTSRGMLHCI